MKKLVVLLLILLFFPFGVKSKEDNVTYMPNNKFQIIKNNKTVLFDNSKILSNYQITQQNILDKKMTGKLIIYRAKNDYLDNDSLTENATYEIIDSEGKKQIATTDTLGIITLDLPIGKVTIKEIKPSIGYEKDNKIYTTYITDNTETKINIFPRLIVKKIIIITKYLEDPDLIAEANSVFSIIKSNNMKLSTKTNSFGKLSFIIPYGKYIIRQETTIPGYDLIEDYELCVQNNIEETLSFINYKTPVIEDIPEIKEDISTETENKFPNYNESEENNNINEDANEEKPNPENNNFKEETLNNETIKEDDKEIPNVENNNTKEEILDKEIIEQIKDDSTISKENNLEKNEIIKEDILNNIKDNKNDEQNNFISNPKTSDNVTAYLILLIISSLVLGTIIRKMH